MKCFLCKSEATDEHHLIGGTGNRHISDEEHLTVMLCRSCHRDMHERSSSQSMSKMLGELIWEREHDGDREAFRRKFGRNYI